METGGENLVLSMEDCERVTDEFYGIKVWWDLRKLQPPKSTYVDQGKRFYKLTFHERNREMVTQVLFGACYEDSKGNQSEKQAQEGLY